MAIRLDSFFKKFLDKKGGSALGIDIGSASIKVVQLRRVKGQAILETYGELSLGPYANVEVGRATKLSPEKIVEALKDVLTEANISTVNSAISIPMRSSMVSLIRMPKMSNKQLQQMVPIEARKYIPVPITEVALDWFVIPKVRYGDEEEDEEEREDAKKEVDILTVAIHNDVLSNYSSIVTGAQLQTSFFEIEMFSTVRSIVESNDNTPVMIFDMGAGATKVYIVERGIVRESHIMNKGSQDITLTISQSLGISVEFAEKLKRNHGKNDTTQDQHITEISALILNPLFNEANTALLNFQKKTNKTVSKVIMIGGGCLLPGIVDKAQQRFALPTYAGDSFMKVQKPEYLQDVLAQTGLAFAPAVGLALRKLQELN